MNSGYDDLIDMALDMKDEEWFKELLKKKNEYIDYKNNEQKEVISKNKETVSKDNVFKYIYDNKSIALEDLKWDICVKLEYGIRNIVSGEDILLNHIVKINNNNKIIKRKEEVFYSDIEDLNKLVILGYYLGMNSMKDHIVNTFKNIGVDISIYLP